MRLVERGRRVIRGALDDNITGEAAKAAYYFFLSLFPLLLVGFAGTAVIGGEAAWEHIMAWLTGTLPDDATEYVTAWLGDVADSRGGVLSFGVLLTAWAASNFFAAIGDGLDAMFDVRARASWWKKRLKALLLMLVGGLVLVGGAVALVAGPDIAQAVGMGAYTHLLAWPVVFALLVVLLWLVYYIMPAHDQNRLRRELLVGAVAGTSLWLLGTAAFRFYVTNVADFGRVYGFIGGVIVLLLWLYVSAIAILLGGEVADTLAREKHGEAHAPQHAH